LDDEVYQETSYDTLLKLQQSAIEKGKNLAERSESRELLLEKLFPLFNDKNWLREYSNEEYTGALMGLDGSMQVISGFGNIHFIPWSVALVYLYLEEKFDPDIESNISEVEADKDELEIKDKDLADVLGEIVKIEGNENKAVRSTGTKKMLERETYMISRVKEKLQEKKIQKGAILIDGPLVDPPNWRKTDYVRKRCQALKEVSQDIPILGIAKRIKERFYLEDKEEKIYNYSKDLYKNIYKNNVIYDDRDLITGLAIEKGQLDTSMYTDMINVEQKNDLYKKYSKNGVSVQSFFYKNSIRSPVIRVDTIKEADYSLSEYVSILEKSYLKGLEDPLPVMLAHEKCQISKSCAESLKMEISNRSAKGSKKTQLSNLIMR